VSQGAGMGYLSENTGMASRIFRSNAVHIVNVLVTWELAPSH
jgi:hypothetical protein